MSNHEVRVIKIKELIKHSNADSLEIIPIMGYTAIVRIGDFKVGDLIAYIEPDYVVPDTEQFAFLAGKRRIKCKRLRKVMSHGLVIPAPAGAQEGDNVMEQLGVIRYEPPMTAAAAKLSKGGVRTHAKAPKGIFLRRYELEPYRKNKDLLRDGEDVHISEKVHGSNASFVFSSHDNKMHCKSRNHWWRNPNEVTWLEAVLGFIMGVVKKVFPRKFLNYVLPRSWLLPVTQKNNLWWTTLDQNPWIAQWCIEHPDTVLIGEVYGDVQDLKYGHEQGQFSFAVFDISKDGEMLSPIDLIARVPMEHRVPSLYLGPLDRDILLSHVDGKSKIPGAGHQIREGIVIKNMHGVALKFVSDEYLERA